MRIIKCPVCLEETSPEDMVIYKGRTMCQFCAEAEAQKAEEDRYWQEQELKDLDS